MKRISWLWGLFLVLLFVVFSIEEASATSQWARKYDMNCQTCHTAFPRLSYFGEKFARNGYQLPGTEDGEEMKEKINNATFIDKLENMFGLRVNVSPATVTTKTLSVDGSRKQMDLNLGNSDWLQLFTAGSIFKNASVFIETEIKSDSSTVAHNNWFTLGYHNLFDTSLLNLRVGKLSMMNWFSQTGRLRMVPNINTDALRARPSRGFADATDTATLRAQAPISTEDSTRASSAVPAVELYGYKNYFLYSLGFSNGTTLDDPNQYKDFFGTLRLEVPDGDFAGSNISTWGMLGTDTVGTAESSLRTALAQAKNTYYRTALGANVRWKDLDAIVFGVYEKEKNQDLATNLRNTAFGYGTQVGYMINPKWHFTLQWDKFQDKVNSANEYHKISQSIAYFPRENMRIGFTVREEIRKRGTGRQHEALLNIRAMF